MKKSLMQFNTLLIAALLVACQARTLLAQAESDSALRQKVRVHLHVVASADLSAVKPFDFLDGWVKGVLTRHDPKTRFGPYVFALKNPRLGILSPSQVQKMSSVIDESSALKGQLHDERNTVRCYIERLAWEYATADSGAAKGIRNRVEKWMDLRIEYMNQESVVAERFFRAAWNVLTPEQQKSLILGKYDASIKKNMGHKRLFSSDKQVRKAFGDPSNHSAWSREVEMWSSKFNAVQVEYARVADVARRCELAFDIVSSKNHRSVVAEQHRLFRQLCLIDFDARRAIYQASYATDATNSHAMAVKAASSLWKKAAKYEKAKDLLAMFPPLR